MSHVGQDGHGEEPVSRTGLELGVEVVEDLGAQGAQRRVLDHVGEFLASQADDAREDDLGEDAHLVEELEPGHRVVGARVGLVDLPFVQPSNDRPFTPSRSMTPPAPARPRISPSTTQEAVPSTGVTWGTRSFSAAGARLVHRSWGSVKWVSASTTLTWSSGRVMRVPLYSRRRQNAAPAIVTVAAFPVTGNHLHLGCVAPIRSVRRDPALVGRARRPRRTSLTPAPARERIRRGNLHDRRDDDRLRTRRRRAAVRSDARVAGSAWMLRASGELALELAGHEKQVLIWDRPNTGASDVCFRGASESEMQADMLAGLLEALGLGSRGDRRWIGWGPCLAAHRGPPSRGGLEAGHAVDLRAGCTA